MTIAASDLRPFDVLAVLDDAELSALGASATVVRLADGEPLFVAHQPARSLFALRRGQVVLRASFDGRSTIVMTARAGDVLGWSALREDAEWLTTGRSAGESEAIAIPVDAVLAVLGSRSSSATRLVRALFGLAARHLAETQAQLLGRGDAGPITGG